jgi:flagellar basal-body rod modification protein FlgD
MAISGVSGTGSTSNSTPSSSMIDNPNSNLGKTDFLQMLITKLRYQDPTDPIKDESFVADMAQFSSLEQMQNMNTGFSSQIDALDTLNTNLIGLMMMQNTTQAASLIGKSVTVGYQEIDAATGATVDKTLTGAVDVVKFVDGQPKLVIGGKTYDLSTVKEISA